MVQDVYVWQRDWNEAVTQSVKDHANKFEHVVVLHSEVSWTQQNNPLQHITLDFDTLRSSAKGVGLTLRIGPFSGPFHADDERTQWLTNICVSMLVEAQTQQVPVFEIQLDFDCAESKLVGYRLWAQAIRAAITPTPLILTALPSWLDQNAFKNLVESVDGYVLQVHSLSRPKASGQSIELCDPLAAKRAVEIAGRLGVPFRVALPTYGYQIAFDQFGQFAGLSAETLPSHWPVKGSIQETWADPQRMAWLVNEWTNYRPKCMQGLIWFRLPVQGDRMNWSWPTLAAVREGRTPRENIISFAENSGNGLIEVFLENRGEVDGIVGKAVRMSWAKGQLVTGDGIGGFILKKRDSQTAVFTPDPESPKARIRPGQRLVIGWLRLSAISALNFTAELVAANQSANYQ
jgi:hypothetical protein